MRPALKRRRGHRTRISTFFGLQPRTHLQSRRTGSCAAFAGVLLEQLLLRDPSDLLPEVCWQLDSCDRLLVMALLCSDNKSYVLQATPFGRGRGRCPPSAVKFPPVTDLKAVLTSPALAGAHPLDPRSCPVVGSLLGPGMSAPGTPTQHQSMERCSPECSFTSNPVPVLPGGFSYCL